MIICQLIQVSNQLCRECFWTDLVFLDVVGWIPWDDFHDYRVCKLFRLRSWACKLFKLHLISFEICGCRRGLLLVSCLFFFLSPACTRTTPLSLCIKKTTRQRFLAPLKMRSFKSCGIESHMHPSCYGHAWCLVCSRCSVSAQWQGYRVGSSVKNATQEDWVFLQAAVTPLASCVP